MIKFNKLSPILGVKLWSSDLGWFFGGIFLCTRPGWLPQKRYKLLNVFCIWHCTCPRDCCHVPHGDLSDGISSELKLHSIISMHRDYFRALKPCF